MADSTSFDIDISTTGGTAAESAAASVAKLAARLTESSAAATQAADAVKTGEAAYKQAEAAAVSAAKSLEKIGLAAEAAKAKLAGMAAGSDGGVNTAAYQRAQAKVEALSAAQAAAAAKSSSLTASMNAEAAALDRLRGSASGAADAEKKLTSQHDAAKKKLDDSAKSTKAAEQAQTKSIGAAGELEGALGKLGGPLGALGQKAVGAGGAILKLGKSLGEAGPYVAVAVAVAAIVASVIAVAAAAAAAAVAVGVWAVTLADAARTQGLMAAGIARTVAGGEQLNQKINDLADTVPQTRDELLALAAPLAEAGLRGQELSDALEASAIKAAKLKFGPDFQKQMLSIPSQIARVQSGFSKIFSGLKIEALLAALSRVTDLFKENSATANAVKVVFESLFQPLIDGVTAFVPKFVAAFIQFEISVMKAIIAIKPYGSVIIAVGVALGVLAAAVLFIGALIVGTLVVAMMILMAPLTIVIALIIYFREEIAAAGESAIAFGQSILDGIGGAIDWLSSLSLSEIGTSLIDGLVAGIADAGPKVLASITGIATGAITAAKKALGIASPSKVFAEIGMHTAAGMEEGVDGGADAVQGSIESLVAPPAMGAAALPGAGSAASGGAGGDAKYSIVINGASGDDDFIAKLRKALQDLESQLGGGAPSAT